MLGREHAGAEHSGIIIRQYRYRSLRDDGTGVKFGHDMMHAAAMQFHALGQSALMRAQTTESGQKRGMDIEQTALPARDESFAQHPHEARQSDQFDLLDPQPFIQRLLEGGAGVNASIETICRNARRGRF